MKPFTELTNRRANSNPFINGQQSGTQKGAQSPPIFSQSSLYALEASEMTIKQILPKKSLQMREQLFKWVIAKCRLTLELKPSTVEHCLRMFDAYMEARGTFAYTVDEAQLILLACLFISNKYQEIYPCKLSDFEYVSKYKFLGKDILQQEILILQRIDYRLNFPLISDYIYALTGKSMPESILLCLPHLAPNSNYRKIAETVVEMGLHQDNGVQYTEDEIMAHVLRIVEKKY